MQIETYILYTVQTNEVISSVSFKHAYSMRTGKLARVWLWSIVELMKLDLSFVEEPLDALPIDNLLDAVGIAMQGTGRKIIWTATGIR